MTSVCFFFLFLLLSSFIFFLPLSPIPQPPRPDVLMELYTHTDVPREPTLLAVAFSFSVVLNSRMPSGKKKKKKEKEMKETGRRSLSTRSGLILFSSTCGRLSASYALADYRRLRRRERRICAKPSPRRRVDEGRECHRAVQPRGSPRGSFPSTA